jgi:hypothetical protein
VAACSEGVKVKVNGGGVLRGRQGRGQRWWCDSVYGLRKRTAVAHSEASDEATTCSVAGNEVAVCSGPG